MTTHSGVAAAAEDGAVVRVTVGDAMALGAGVGLLIVAVARPAWVIASGCGGAHAASIPAIANSHAICE